MFYTAKLYIMYKCTCNHHHSPDKPHDRIQSRLNPPFPATAAFSSILRVNADKGRFQRSCAANSGFVQVKAGFCRVVWVQVVFSGVVREKADF